MTIIERYMSSQKAYGSICTFGLKCAGVVWLILIVVFLIYWSSFFLGNHDFRFMRYGVPLDAGVFEGRFTQFLPSWLLTGGHILPVFNVLLGFAFLPWRRSGWPNGTDCRKDTAMCCRLLC